MLNLGKILLKNQSLIKTSFQKNFNHLKSFESKNLFSEKIKSICKPEAIKFSTGSKNWQKIKLKLSSNSERVGIAALGAGQIVLAGSSLVGLGALCYYGLGLSSTPGIIDEAALWPKYVQVRVRDVYMHFLVSLAATAASSYAVSQSPELLGLVSKNGFLGVALTIAALMGTSMLCNSIEYTPGFGPKQLSWLLHTSVLGAVIAPLTVLGGPLLLRAAIYTAGVCGGMSTVAMCAPSEKFLNWGGPLAAGLGVVFLASIGSAFLPPTGAVGLSLYSISMYGGLVLFSLFILHDTQRIVHAAKNHPENSFNSKSFDPIRQSMSIYMDTINIFIRIAMIMANSSGNRKR